MTKPKKTSERIDQLNAEINRLRKEQPGTQAANPETREQARKLDRYLTARNLTQREPGAKKTIRGRKRPRG